MVQRGNFNGQEKMVSILKARPSTRLTSKQISQLIFETYPKDCEQKRARSSVIKSDEELIGQISAELGAFWRTVVDTNDQIQFVETRPREFYFDLSGGTETEVIPQHSSFDIISNKNKSFHEEELYPILGEVIFNEMRCFAMRIEEKASSNKHGQGGNHWLYPDVVGMIPLSDKWGPKVSVLADTLAAERVQLVSFEVKKDIKRSDVREKFFQTVSNSAWANYSYLAAAELKGGQTSDELTLLCSSYGIGFILIDKDEPSNSQIKIPARLRESIDVNALNRLADENSDAKEFVENVSTYIKTGRLKKGDWDLIPDNKS